jgi:hypothetical protein
MSQNPSKSSENAKKGKKGDVWLKREMDGKGRWMAKGDGCLREMGK